ncbi:glutathione S-transferase family protein [Sphingomonas immobilis]|uniref:Glutathione S-transferase family protein n=1 Tax=Sphingomonas immobilis TaxID=3063997 RepID=A0ABT9A0M6_9SPHN|nr:glutathione S-transferase family protein [Sphingomonas sp. CA1-15]MDO7843386.1 glutathione S-transferase family protein [Sphingomonas sp. CA1-15]
MPEPVYTLYQFPGCPFSERVEILLSLKGLENICRDVEIDLSKPRPDWLLAKTGGTTALPALDMPHGTLKESAVILRFFEQTFPEPPVARADPYEHGVESIIAALDGALSGAAYALLRNRDRAQDGHLRLAVDGQFARIDAALRHYATHGDFVFDRFGWAETVFTPVFKRLWFLEYYCDYTIPAELARVAAWRAACLEHPAAQARSREEILKLYYDYSRGAGGGALVEGREVSSFTLDPHWSTRPMPPRDKWAPAASDRALGLLA